jgi:hypothetical protein
VSTAGGWLNKPWAKGVVLLVFLGYLASSCWGVTFLQEGLEKKRLSRQDHSAQRCQNGKKEWHCVVVAYSLTCAGSETALKGYIYKRKIGGHYDVVILSNLRRVGNSAQRIYLQGEK